MEIHEASEVLFTSRWQNWRDVARRRTTSPPRAVPVFRGPFGFARSLGISQGWETPKMPLKIFHRHRRTNQDVTFGLKYQHSSMLITIHSTFDLFGWDTVRWFCWGHRKSWDRPKRSPDQIGREKYETSHKCWMFDHEIWRVLSSKACFFSGCKKKLMILQVGFDVLLKSGSLPGLGGFETQRVTTLCPARVSLCHGSRTI